MRNKTNRWCKVLSLVLCGALLCAAGTGGITYAAGAKTAEQKTTAAAERIGTATEGTGVRKEETVYVIAGADGAAQKIIVSDWIKNPDSAAEITDKTELNNVTNVKGNETYTLNNDHMCVWNAQGNDIYYQGNSTKDLPINVSIHYQLNGKEISAQDLAGKNGKVTIRFDYKNSCYKMVEIDGKQEKINVPFAVLTGMLLDNDRFKNISVSNGKLINDGDHTVVAGIAFPGFAENLDVDTDKLGIPDYVEVTADVTDFSLETTVTMATNEVFNEINLDQLNGLDGLSGSLDQLTAAMDQLLDGSSQLYDGLAALLDQSGNLISGIDQLAAGAQGLSAGAGKLDSGAADLQAGAAQLSSGLGELIGKNSELNAGAKQVFESLLSQADAALKAAGLTVDKLTIDNYDSVLGGVLASLDADAVYQLAYQTAYSQVETAVRTNEATIRAGVEGTVRDTVLETVLGQMGIEMTADQYREAVIAGSIQQEKQEQIDTVVNTQMTGDSIKAKITEETENQIQKLIAQNMKSAEITSKINAAVEDAKSGSSQITALKTQLDSYNQFYQGLIAYTNGVAQAKTGADTLKSGIGTLKGGSADLKEGAQQVFGGLSELQRKSGALTDGVTRLKDGAMQLSDGLAEFNEQGVQKLVDLAQGDAEGLLTRLRATVNVSKEYQSFAGIADGMDGTVRFIYKTAAIQKSDNES